MIAIQNAHRRLHRFHQPICEYTGLRILDLSQPVVPLGGSCILHFSALEVVEIDVCSHDRLFVHVVDVQHAREIVEVGKRCRDLHLVKPIDVFRSLWVLDVLQPVVSRHEPVVVQ